MPWYQAGPFKPAGDLQILEFIGGPLDGFRYALACQADELVETVALPVNPNVIRMLQGRRLGNKASATSVAIYELRDDGSPWHYCFIGSTSAKQCQLDDWVG